jgi:hypothetical protein
VFEINKRLTAPDLPMDFFPRYKLTSPAGEQGKDLKRLWR